MTDRTRTISTKVKLAQQLFGEKKDEESPWAKYFRRDLELARKYLEERAAMCTQQKNAGDTPREVVSPSTPSLNPQVTMMYD